MQGSGEANMRALICGISGQDGAYLADLLLKKGYEVFGTSRDIDVASFANLNKLGILHQVNLVSMAINDFRSVLQVINNVRPDEIYNLAGQSSVGLSFEQPVETMESISLGTLNLLEAIRFIDTRIKFYNAGSGECFGNAEDRAADESSSFRPRSPYAVAKSSAFWQVANYREAYDLFACTGILFNHESPLRGRRFVTRKIIASACRIASGKTEILYLGNLEIQRDWGWAPEYVEAMWMMLQQQKPDDYVIATGETRSLQDFVSAAFHSVGLDWREHTKFDSNLFRPTDLAIGRANPTKAKAQLGWVATKKMEDVVRAMIEHEMATMKAEPLYQMASQV
jgi:GDPmannose 4,6-dehydratase